jgi:hypothetical protein
LQKPSQWFDSLEALMSGRRDAGTSMQKRLLAFAFLLLQVVFPGATRLARAQVEKSAYPAMAPPSQYLMTDRASEVALARSAAPASISDGAEVQVLERSGYTVAVAGTNGFVCLVERSFGAATDFPEFWNPKIRAPICVNAPAARTYLPAVRLKAKLVFAGESNTQIAQAIQSALERKELPALEPAAMCYMMSKQQYLANDARNWHPHMMWFVPGDQAKSWGANLSDSPLLATYDPEDRMTIFLVWVGNWSDGTPAPRDMH